MIRHLALAAMALGALACVNSAVSAATDIKLLSFPGASNLPIWVAQEKGLFAKEGVNLVFSTTTGSVDQVRDLYAGKIDVISTAFDNIVAYTEGQGDFVPPGPLDMIAVLGVHTGMNSVMTPSDIKSYAGIKGKAVAVDALKSGYGLVLYQILQTRGGLALDKDYTAISVGNTDRRLAAMREGKAVAAIVGAPQDMDAARQGFRLMADAATELGDYLGSAIVARRPWIKDHTADLEAMIRAMVAAHDSIFADKPGSIAIMRKHLANLSAEDADKLYDRLVAPGGLSPHAAITIKGVENVLKIRETYGEPKKPMGPPSRYVDTSYYDHALADKAK